MPTAAAAPIGPDVVDRAVDRLLANHDLENGGFGSAPKFPSEPDLELLLVRFLNELVYLRDAEDLLLHAERIEIARGDGARLRGELAGERIDRNRHDLATDVKAATAHGLSVAQTSEGWTASATLDV